MSWAKIDDRFWIHPKVTSVGNAGAGIFARMLSYCGCFLTNGLVPADVVAIIVGADRDVLQLMHDRGTIEIYESGAVHIRDYLDYNPPKDKVEADREAARLRMQERRNGAKRR